MTQVLHRAVSGINNPMYGISRKGKDIPFFNKKHSTETLELLKKSKTVEHKNKLSIAKQGENNLNFGKKQSIETCAKRSESIKGRVPWNKGLKGVKSLKDLKI